MKKVLREKLGDGAAYSTELSKDIADEIRKELKSTDCFRAFFRSFRFLQPNTPDAHDALLCLRFLAPQSALNVPRYKYIVQVVMGEQKGEGIQIGSRFFWDSDTDKFATESFSNVSLPVCHCGCRTRCNTGGFFSFRTSCSAWPRLTACTCTELR
jgi:Tctex-1 family